MEERGMRTYLEVSVTEMLPKKDGRYFCLFNDSLKTCMFSVKDGYFYTNLGKEYVTHWLDCIQDDNNGVPIMDYDITSAEQLVDEFTGSLSKQESITFAIKTCKILYQQAWVFGSSIAMRHWASILRRLKDDKKLFSKTSLKRK